MRKHFLWILIIGLCSCKFFPHNNWHTQIIKLGDSISFIGQVQIKLPKEYDTLIVWTDYSDDRCDDIQYNRIQSKKFPRVYDTIAPRLGLDPFGTESKYDFPDSLYGLTISQSYCAFYNYFLGSDSFDVQRWITNVKAREIQNNPFDSDKIKNKTYTIVKINGLNFITDQNISNINDKRKTITTRKNLKFYAFTGFNKIIIRFTFENSTTNFKKEDYFKACLEILKTVKFTK